MYKREKDAERPKVIVTLDVLSQSISLKRLEDSAGTLGLFGSFSKGEPIPKYLQPIEHSNVYSITRLRLLEVDSSPEPAVRRLARVQSGRLPIRLRQLRKRFGSQIKILAILAVFCEPGTCEFLLPPSFLSLIQNHDVAVRVVVYSEKDGT